MAYSILDIWLCIDTRDNEAARRLYRKAGFEAREKYVLMTAHLEDGTK